MKINQKIVDLEEKNIFLNITNIINEYKKNNPKCELLSLGIGDVSLPIIKPVVDNMHKAVDELSKEETFKGYNSCFGYDFLKHEILKHEYSKFNFTSDEVYISNGTKSDCTNILELFSIDCKICVFDMMYPIYHDASLCLNRNVTILPVLESNNFMPLIPKEKYDIIYICSPCNPTGICYSYDELKPWVDYAIKNNSVILYDNVYYPFICSKKSIRSIYEIEGAKEVAIEFRSFSKVASFSGVRCSYYVIPNELYPGINHLWQKRTINRFNGTDYIAQKGALAVYSKEAQSLIKENINYYKNNTKKLREAFIKMGFTVYGGIDSPYLWVKIKDNMTSWELFTFYLEKLNIIIIPGIIFGNSGDKYFRVSGLGNSKVVDKAIKVLENYYEKN